MAKAYSRKPDSSKRIARERIVELFRQAELSSRQDLSDRYVFLARKIAMKYKVRLPPEYRRRFCRSCGAFFRFGENCRVRLQDGKAVYYCLTCKKFHRFPYGGRTMDKSSCSNNPSDNNDQSIRTTGSPKGL